MIVNPGNVVWITSLPLGIPLRYEVVTGVVEKDAIICYWRNLNSMYDCLLKNTDIPRTEYHADDLPDNKEIKMFSGLRVDTDFRTWFVYILNTPTQYHNGPVVAWMCDKAKFIEHKE